MVKIIMIVSTNIAGLSNRIKSLISCIRYSKENNISIIMRKKDLVIARSDLDITIQIIDLVNSKVKKIKLN